MRTLIVDDSEDGRDVAEAILASAGYEGVTAFGSARDVYLFLEVGQGVDHLASPVDLILLDVVMPGVDGLQICARIRKERRYADVPIIMMTAIDDVDRLAEAFAAGANDYIVKPLNPTELLARTRAASKLRAELDRRRQSERELIQFMSAWGSRRATKWIDDPTGLLVGEIAEAYLTSFAETGGDETSVIALAVDQLGTYRLQGSELVAEIFAKVAGTIQSTIADVGVIAGAYPNGTMVLVGPHLSPERAAELGEAMRTAVGELNAGADAREGNLTASVAIVSGRAARDERVHLLARAITAIPSVTAAGGNRVVCHWVQLGSERAA